MEPKDVKSLESNEGGVLAEDRSENNSSNSDIVHVEQEEAELLEAEAGSGSEVAEAGILKPEMQESMLNTDSELVELGTETPKPDNAPVDSETSDVFGAPETLESTDTETTELSPPVVGVEDAGQGEIGPLSTEAPIKPESLPPAHDLPPPPKPEPDPELLPAQSQQDSEVILEHAPLIEVESSGQEALLAPPEEKIPGPRETKSELPILLYGGAALVAIGAVLVYGAMVYRKK